VTTTKPRTFDDRPAVREQTPVLVGLVGPSSSGKTYSALRLATGIQRVVGGEIFGIDTEARRMLHYAEKFKFRYVPFGHPFSPLDYLGAIEHCVKKGAKTIIVDSMSHEHEGPGGVLEMHEEELDRMAKGDWEKRNKMTFAAWAKPKAQRRRLINTILQLPCNFIFCFRAKPKLKIQTGKDPVELGYQPIAGDEFIYEMTLKCLLLPGANGVPTWSSDMIGEKAMIKLPEQFRALFTKSPAPQLTEEIGEILARWGAGAASSVTSAADLIARYTACSDPATLRTLEEVRGQSWPSLSKDEKAKVKASAEEAKKRVEAAASTSAPASSSEAPKEPVIVRDEEPIAKDETGQVEPLTEDEAREIAEADRRAANS
jgi:hypothetical protein